MKLLLDRTLKPKEWICLAAGLMAAGVLYAVLIHPSLRSFAELEQARVAKTKAEEELERFRTEFEDLQRQIAEGKKQLTELGGSPPHVSEKDLQIARITALARRCRISIDQYSPIDTIDETDHRAFFVQFIGRGEFASIQQYFNGIESDIEFVDVTHFTLSSVPNDASPVCFVTWCCRINGIQTDGLAGEPASIAG